MFSDDHRSPSMFSCCFRCYEGSDEEKPRLLRRSSAWLRSRAHELPELRDKCRSLFSKVGREGMCRTRHAGDFKYDPLSYALNFDDESLDEEARLHDFSARYVLAPAPVNRGRTAEESSVAVVSREITCS
ncbi:hypothetical protein EJ110_NYTH30767 [Nymphaea thermarum]|nr:hypothetical protein EJ110_NYTH30767 [Nymphaea thermarum]